MDRSVEINLVAEEYFKDEYGISRTITTKHKAYAQMNSITRAEFYDAGRNGLNPEFSITMFAGDYNGERVVEYDGKTYGVYRTYYARTDTVELYVERKGGTNGKAD